MLRWIPQHAFQQLWKSYRKFTDDDGPLLAAAVSYYLALSFLPILMVLVSGLGLLMRFSGWGQDAQQRVLDAIANQTSQELAGQVREILSQVETQAVFSGPVGLITLLVASMAIFVNFERAFDRIWRVPESPKRGLLGTAVEVLFFRLRAFVMLSALGLLLLATLIGGLAITTAASVVDRVVEVRGLLQWSQVPLALVLNGALFTALYRFLPRQKVHWSAACKGGLLTALTWELGRQALAWLVIGDKYTSAYGLLGSLIAIMLWGYYACTVVFIGAEFTQLLDEELVAARESNDDPS